MAGVLFQELSLKDAYLIESFSSGDYRGSFTKVFEKNIFMQNGIDFFVDESFVSISSKNVIRGLHFQTHNPQAKLVCVPCGKVFDVLVDLRIDSPTFKQWLGFELSGENHRALYIPRGFAHGFASLEDNTAMLYYCDGAYDKETDTGIRFDDPEIAVSWPVDIADAVVSDRDRNLMSFREYCEHSGK